MFEAICLLTAGVLIGRLWAWLKTETQVTDCPRCAVEDREQQTLMEISAMRRMGEDRMREAAGERRRPDAPGHYGDNEQWPTGRFGRQ